MSTNSIFTGSSAYSADFQNVITRSVSIASLPIKQMAADKAVLTTQSTDLKTLDTSFTSLQTALDGVSHALRGPSFQTSVSDPAVASVAISDGALEGNYSIDVSDVGDYATSLTAASWVTAAAPAHTFHLHVGAASYDVSPADNSAASLAAALNSQQGDKVRATVVNVGSSASPDYRISLRATALGDTPVNLFDGVAGLQTQQTVGRVASYEVNGSGLTVTSTSRTVSISTGVSVNLLTAGAGPVNLTVTRSTSALSDALSAFANAYNAAVDAVDHQRGQGAGSLQGQPVMQDLSRTLSSISTYGNLSNLGLSLDSSGKLTFSPFTLLASDIVNSAGVTAFLGSPETGGFLKAATDALKQTSFQTVQTGIASQIAGLDSRIAGKQSQIDQLQLRLEQQMSTADALIASMQQRYTFLSAVFEASKIASEQYK